MPGERYPHLFLAGPDRTQPFTNPRGNRTTQIIPERDTAQHSNYLRSRLERVWIENDDYHAVAHIDRRGVYIDFISEPGFDLMMKSLERVSSGIRLLNVRQHRVEEMVQTSATVFVPNTQRPYFLKKIRAYADEVDRRTGKPKNLRLINSISDIRRAVLGSFWTDTPVLLPDDSIPAWVEVWLSSDNDEIVQRFQSLLRLSNIQFSEGVLKFPERAVLLICASREQLGNLVEMSDNVAEFKAAKEIATVFTEMENRDQAEWVLELIERTRFEDNGVSIAILDSGVNNGHPLLQPLLDDADCHGVDPRWGAHDDRGHGTLMAGTAAYGDLLAVLSSREPVLVCHRLESAKILPPPPAQNPRELWGDRISQGVSRTEIQAPDRKRILCLAVSSTDDRDNGRPSSWSALIDKLSSGHDDGVRRLFVVCAGNTFGSEEFRNYPYSNITNEVHDPGQSWNALTVGAYTEKVRIVDPFLRGYSPIAPLGGLSPFSTTSTTWERKWPVKPDVVFEGGNVARGGPNDSVFDTDDLKLISTCSDLQIAQFAPFDKTSAATAQASWMAAVIQTQYPEMWPETVRALIVHTAEWTEAMLTQFMPVPPRQPSKGDYTRLLRICGYGVPNLERALYCASNSLTLVSEAEIQPYGEHNGRYVTQDMHFYRLPWPLEVLRDLGETEIRMRVTLSYFIEPGPGEVGWRDRYRYASHALQFAVNGPGESQEDFIRRINKKARDEDGHPRTTGPGDKWLIGDNGRNVGSLHSDIWKGRAVDLAQSNMIAIYPTVGWWRERHHLGRVTKETRYTLLVSINAPSLEIDIYTPVAISLGITVPVPIAIS